MLVFIFTIFEWVMHIDNYTQKHKEFFTNFELYLYYKVLALFPMSFNVSCETCVMFSDLYKNSSILKLSRINCNVSGKHILSF